MAEIELIKGSDNGNPPDKLSQAYPKINRNLGRLNTQLVGHIDNSDIHVTAADHAKLNGISSGAQVNQNSFAIVNGMAAISPSDEVKFVADAGVIITENPLDRSVHFTVSGEMAPGNHALTHLTESGIDPIPHATTTTSGLMSPDHVAQLVETTEQLFNAQPLESRVNILDYLSAVAEGRNTFTITKDNHSTVAGEQSAALFVRNGISATHAREEVGVFSVLDVLGNDQHHVGIYSQVNASGANTSFLYGACVEVKNTQPDGNGTSSNQALIGLEIDIVNKYEYDGLDIPDTRKTGISLVAWGGGTSHEAIGVYSSGGKNGDGTYQSGDWLYGLIMRTNSVDNNNGTGILLQSDHSVGLRLTGKSKYYGIDLASHELEPGSVGINVNENYSIAIAVPANKFIKINGAGGSEGIFYDSIAGALTLSAQKLSLLNHTAATSATLGSNGAAPSQVAGYIKCIVGGVERRIPFYNV